ncbi:MAG: glycosyltransferase family 2 protein [Pseudanabaenaceae cyanobacterium bins.68]|nr:glycosyltransferase family 2 protein [Pseudanabaenaceae cyanobacterium bins.68]
MAVELKPLVLLAIPTYNGEQFLAAAIASAVAQTYTNYQILIADDHSQDRTLEIAQVWAARYPQITVISHQRLGLGGNWNFCVEYGRSRACKYLKFLCQDDLLLPHCLTEMVKVAELGGEHLGMVFSPRELIGEVPPSLAWLRDIHRYWHDLQTHQPGLDLLSDRAWLEPPDNKFGEPSNVLIPMAVFGQIGLFDQDFQQYCDLEMWLRICTRFEVIYLDQTLSSFRIHPQQTSQTNQQADLVWAEIYLVWGKILHDPIYAPLPTRLKTKLWWHFLSQAMAEYRRIFWYGHWHRLGKLNALARSLLLNS